MNCGSCLRPIFLVRRIVRHFCGAEAEHMALRG
jgi:hypothetical protein